MALLPEAIRNSPNESAQCHLPDGSTLLVKRVVGLPESNQVEEYAVSLQRGHDVPQEIFATDNLAEVLDRLEGMRLPGLDAATASWQPANSNVEQWAP